MSNALSIINSFGNQRMEDIGIWAFIFTILFATITAFIFSWLYNYFFAKRATGSQINRAFPLLAIAITVIFPTVQFSLPLSLGLLGALSIVRFRTPIKEPEEIGFIMLVVASSLSCATFNFIFPVLLVFVSWSALYLSTKFSLFGMNKLEGGMITITGKLGENSQEQLIAIEKDLCAVFPKVTLHSISKREDIVAAFIFHGAENSTVTNSLIKTFSQYPDFDFNLIVNHNSAF